MFKSAFLRDLAERIARQLLQVAPTLMATGDPTQALLGLAVAAGFTVLKTVSRIAASPGAPLWQALADRAGAAAAGAFLALFPGDVVDWGAVDWGGVWLPVLVPTLISIMMYFVTPPTRGPQT